MSEKSNTWFTTLSLFLIGALAGFLESGFNGLVAGVFIVAVLAFITMLGLIPLIGGFLFIYVSGKVKALLASYGILKYASLTWTIIWWIDFVAVLIVQVILAFLVVYALRGG